MRTDALTQADVKEWKASRLTAGEAVTAECFHEGAGFCDFLFFFICLKGQLLWEVGGSLLDLIATLPAHDICCGMSQWSAGACSDNARNGAKHSAS